ncbi:sigma-70 family RNA polymerase sigma factor [Herbiconiux sp. VKM Ac-1786]|uniref:sigma-70 family RNA polymerase sigma factor n=1 Tax=Herbiconiux sp. VKM Ac-1786 TaxID=2783824 RepID=UPI00188C95B1|nr:sigma-70 family RNA polymerase sigma factor [Herbiconiux sp. VKM Ac-1786]MBF4574176.1 sigma-70 family RNA polymerase sigma factor [Herbiconiux sp. VKM Ac-1786]
MNDEHAELLRAAHDAHGAALFRYVVRLTRDPGMAEDVVQETLLRAGRKPAILEQGDEEARAWMFTVARNLVIDDRRSARHNREFATDELPERAQADRTDAVLDSWLVSDALLSLSLEHRTAIVRSYYLGETAVEISAAEGVPVGTVRSRMHYALRALRLALQERGVTE